MSTAHRDYFNALAPEWSVRMSDDPEFDTLLIEFGVTAGERVLDTGAGTGRMSRRLAALTGSEGRVVAQDFAFQMLQEGRQAGRDEKIHWLCDDIAALALKEALFDKVLCYSIFPHLQQPESAVREIYRVLKPRGKLLILHTAGSEQLNRFHASLTGVVRHDRLCSPAVMADLLKAAGFVRIKTRENEKLYWVEATKTP